MRCAPIDPRTLISSYVFIGPALQSLPLLDSSVCAHDRAANQCTGPQRPCARPCRKARRASRQDFAYRSMIRKYRRSQTRGHFAHSLLYTYEPLSDNGRMRPREPKGSTLLTMSSLQKKQKEKEKNEKIKKKKKNKKVKMGSGPVPELTQKHAH